MPLAPGSAVRGAAPSLQPHYYTSSLFISPLEEDMSKLLGQFVSEWRVEGLGSPFSLFKKCWKESGWRYIHLQCIESRAREMFLLTIQRQLLAQVASSADGIERAGALFALYILYFTQPSHLYRVDYIPIPIDVAQMLESLSAQFTGPLATEVSYVITQLVAAFRFTPETKYLAPLPTSTIQPARAAGTLKTGRPNEATRRRNYEVSLSRLTRNIAELNEAGPSNIPAPDQYLEDKDDLQQSLSFSEMDLVTAAAQQTSDRMKEIEEWAQSHDPNIEGWDWDGDKKIGLNLIKREGGG